MKKIIIFTLIAICTTPFQTITALSFRKPLFVTAAAFATNAGGAIAYHAFKDFFEGKIPQENTTPHLWCTSRVLMGISTVICSGYVLYHELKQSNPQSQANVKSAHNTDNFGNANTISAK